jgi:hypothetical protein
VDLSPEMLQKVQHLTGREFTKFVTSKGVLRCSDFHSLDEMCSHNMADHDLWMNAGSGELISYLLHYLDCKGNAPSTTSAYRLVRRYRHGSVPDSYYISGQW